MKTPFVTDESAPVILVPKMCSEVETLWALLVVANDTVAVCVYVFTVKVTQTLDRGR